VDRDVGHRRAQKVSSSCRVSRFTMRAMSWVTPSRRRK
jgi:hypothetical protein